MAYINYNVNPKKLKTGDCAIRAVATATGLTWDETYTKLADAGFEMKMCMNSTEVVEKVLVTLGFSIGKIRVVKGQHRPTVESFSKEYRDHYCVLRVANHLVATGRGNYVDIWDCGNSSVYKFWYKKI
jgi:hypothetical protein